MWTSEPRVWVCAINPATQQLGWTSTDEPDCFPQSGYCPGVFTDAACTTALSCPACGEGAPCASNKDCCNGTFCVTASNGGPGQCESCHPEQTSCADGNACCDGSPCDPATHLCPDASIH